MISGRTKVYGIMANPVEHSLSPLMQNFYGKRTGTDFVYVPLKVSDDGVGEAVRGAFALNMAGMNVTIPHKQRVMEFLSETDTDALAIGAVNTLVRTDSGFKGYNTDAAGLFRAVTEEGIVIKDRDCILIGAGGAAKATAYMLGKGGAKTVYILNRNQVKAVKLARDMNELFGRDMMIPLSIEEYQKIPKASYLAVQSTSVGMYPHADAAPIEDMEFYQMIHTGVDIIYTPGKTRFMEHVESCGGRTMNGLNMLLYQGIIAYELWNPGVTVDETAVREARELLINQLEGKPL